MKLVHSGVYTVVFYYLPTKLYLGSLRFLRVFTVVLQQLPR